MIHRRKIILAVLVGLAIITVGGLHEAWLQCGRTELPAFTEPAAAQAATQQKKEKKEQKEKKKRKILYWVAPMDPTYIRDKPGKSPMGMDLVPVYADEVSAGPTIRIDPVTIQDMGIQTAPVERETLVREIRTVGIVTYKEPQQYSINSKIGGWVERLDVDQTGQFVKKGQPMLEIYSPDLVSAQKEYLLALRNQSKLKNSPFPEIAKGGQSLLAAAYRRLKYWDISDQQIEELKKTGKVRKNLVLYAPYDGIVTMKMVTEGMYVKGGKELFQLADISSVWIDAQVYEYELPWLKPGHSAQVEFPYTPQQPLVGKISFIYPYVDPKTRTTKVRLDFPNPGDKLRPDMYVNVDLQAQKVENALVIPTNAILDSGTKQTVFVALEGGKFDPRQVKVGLQGDDGMTQILEGLAPGEKVVTNGEFMLDSESQLKEAVQKMLGPGKSESPPARMKKSPQTDRSDLEGLFNAEKESSKKEDQDLNGLF
ncbi:MAG: efflux RND transporter periplasmic adaptor subunit [Deltaproteobacteria bacterium]